MIDAAVGTIGDRDGWFTSSYTNGTGACVEVMFDQGAVLVRDSKDVRAAHPMIAVGSPGWASFLHTVAR